MKGDPVELIGQRVRTRMGIEGPYIEGVVVVYLPTPCFEIQQDDGKRRAVGIDRPIEVMRTEWVEA